MMGKLLRKELKLGASPLSYAFIAFGLMTLIPGYPISMGAFFVCLGIFQTVRLNREANDILYSALLPVAKRDVVRSKYAFALFIEGCSFLLMAAMAVLRMTVLVDKMPYVNNVMMPANPVFLGLVLLIFAIFNVVFLGGFFKTAYAYMKPYFWFGAVALVLIGLGEALGHVPGLEILHSVRRADLAAQFEILAGCAAVSALLTYLSMRRAMRSFERIDL